MNEIELEKLFNIVSVKFDVGDYDTFKSKMMTKEDRKKFYDKVSVKFNVGNYDDFEKRLSTSQQTTPTGVELAKQRFEAWKKARDNEWLTKNPIEKYVPYTNGTFDVMYKDKSKETIYPNNRSQDQNKEGTEFFMGTYDGNWKFTVDDAKTTYDKYGDKAWLSDEEEKELGIKKNPDTGKYEKIDQNQNTGGSGTSGTSGSSTPKKRGTQLSSQDFEGIDFKYKYPGDRNYRYGVKGTDWYAKNINNQKVFNITKDGFTSSVDKLNTQFPNAFKEVVQPVSPETKTPETPTQDLGQSSKPNTTGYDDYSNDEYEDSSEKPEQEFSTGYEDYTLEEN